MNITDLVHTCGLTSNFTSILRILVNCAKIFFMGSVNSEEKVPANNETHRELVPSEKTHITTCTLFKILSHDPRTSKFNFFTCRCHADTSDHPQQPIKMGIVTPGRMWLDYHLYVILDQIKLLYIQQLVSSPKMADMMNSSSKLTGIEMENRGQADPPVGSN